MLLFWKKRPYDRIEVLAAADRARAGGRVRKAIAGYRKVLAVEPDDASVHGKLAPLLARIRKADEALGSFVAAARGHEKAGFLDRALAMYAQAAGFYPEQVTLWEEMSRLHLFRNRRADAINTLVAGGARLGRREQAADAIRLLHRALELEPFHVDATLGLARHIARTGGRREALACLEPLAARARGRTLRRVRAAQLRIAPSPATVWRWLRAVFTSR